MQDKEQTTQERILEAARAEFLDKGFRTASLRTIVKTAGVTTGALYGYYDSKEALFDALVKESYEYFLPIGLPWKNLTDCPSSSSQNT